TALLVASLMRFPGGWDEGRGLVRWTPVPHSGRVSKLSSLVQRNGTRVHRGRGLERGEPPGAGPGEDGGSTREGVRGSTDGQRVVLSMRPEGDLTTSGRRGQRKTCAIPQNSRI